MQIRPTTTADNEALERLYRAAFGIQEGQDIGHLVRGLQKDATAVPLLSLLATVDDGPVGHVLFSRVTPGEHNLAVAARILSPLAVLPRHQGRGVGKALVREGLAQLREAGVSLVFVLGDPRYYSRFGFVAADESGLAPPHPLPAQWRSAWQVLDLLENGISQLKPGTVKCAQILQQPYYWQE